MSDRPEKLIYIVIPAFNEATVIAAVISEIIAHGYQNIIVIDDGSTDHTQAAARVAGALCLRHKINRGKGAATKTGLQAALAAGADIIVTMDGDGQHSAADIGELIKPLLADQAAITLGIRHKERHAMPRSRQVANFAANSFTWLIHGLWVQDSQSGFKAFSRQAALTIETFSDAYEYESEIIREIQRHALSFHEVPIHARYTPYSQQKKQRQNLVNGLKTAYKMLWSKIV